jgi:enoyl-[acyl-carrier protein] reductase / trans-2-enoyl-CoA reductase (NAD+)
MLARRELFANDRDPAVEAQRRTMFQQVVQNPRIFGFISTSAHPAGCEAEVRRQIAVARRQAPTPQGGRALILGSSMGYGLAARIVAAFRCGMETTGVAFERPGKGKRTASAGWYNTAAFHRAAAEAGLAAPSFMGDAFSHLTLSEVVGHLETRGPQDLFIYSLAAPRRTDPVTGETFTSVLKAVGEPARTKILDTRSGEITETEFERASDEEVRHTVKVMGGEDLERWTLRLLDRGLLKPGVRVLAFSYIGPAVTHPLYRDGSIGAAKKHLEATCRRLNGILGAELGGSCRTVVAKSIVTQSSAAIPAIALYISLAFRVMKEMGLHEDAIDQMLRLFDHWLAPGADPVCDGDGRIRLDDRELREDVQAEIARRWAAIESANSSELADVGGYHADFLRLFGFGVEGVDYELPVDTEIGL